MAISIKVAASGIMALCLVLSALFYVQSVVDPSMQDFGNKFFGFAIALVFIVIVLALTGVRIRLS